MMYIFYDHLMTLVVVVAMMMLMMMMVMMMRDNQICHRSSRGSSFSRTGLSNLPEKWIQSSQCNDKTSEKLWF